MLPLTVYDMMESLINVSVSVYQQFLYVPQLLNDVNENMLYPAFEILLSSCILFFNTF